MLSDLNLAGALQHDIKFVLPIVRMRCVLLAGFERIQSGEQILALHQCALAHLSGHKSRQAGDVLQEHTLSLTATGSSLTTPGARQHSGRAAKHGGPEYKRRAGPPQITPPIPRPAMGC